MSKKISYICIVIILNLMYSFKWLNRSEKNVRPLQNICGAVFISMFACQFIFQSLLFFGKVSPQDTWYAYIVGMLSVVGFSILFKLASNMSSDIFSLCMIGFELFFTIGRPFLLSLPFVDKQAFSIIFYICALFSFLALYMWALLFKNCRFKLSQLVWLMLLPLPFVINILDYAGYLTLFEDINTLAGATLLNGKTVHLMRMVLAIFMPIGYWKLSHSDYFNGSANFVLERTNMNPFNRYFFFYIVLVAILLIPV